MSILFMIAIILAIIGVAGGIAASPWLWLALIAALIVLGYGGTRV